MTYAIDKTATGSAQAIGPVGSAIASFQRLGTDEKLGLLWSVYENMGRAITPAAPGAARMQFAEGLLQQVREMNPQAQLQFMRQLVDKVNTAETRAYGVLSNNTKLAFWYQLAEWMANGIVIPVPEYYQLSGTALEVFGQLSALDFGQQITVLRQIVIDMGVDPLAR